MKLNRVLLLIFFSCAILFVGVVSNIFASITVEHGDYIAMANGWRSGGINNDRLHVNLTAEASTEGYASGAKLTVTLTVNNRPNLTVNATKENIHGSTSLRRKLRAPYEENSATAYAKSEGNSLFAGTISAEATYYVPEMPPIPPPPDPDLPLPIDDCPCDSVGLESVNGLYTATPGDTHEACLMTDAPFYTVDWYVKAPWETSERGSYIEGDSGDGTTTEATFSYTFPSGAMHTGDFLITAVIYRWSDMSEYEESYTVTVSSD